MCVSLKNMTLRFITFKISIHKKIKEKNVLFIIPNVMLHKQSYVLSSKPEITI